MTRNKHLIFVDTLKCNFHFMHRKFSQTYLLHNIKGIIRIINGVSKVPLLRSSLVMIYEIYEIHVRHKSKIVTVIMYLHILLLFQSSSNARVEQEIIKWVNDKLVESGKSESKINSFQDSKIATARPIIDLIDAIKPGVINYELLQENGGTYEVSSFSKQYKIIRWQVYP